MLAPAIAVVVLSLVVGAARAPGAKPRPRGREKPGAASGTAAPGGTKAPHAGGGAARPGVDPSAGDAPEHAPDDRPAQRTKVAVLELSGLGITDITKNLEQYLRNSMATIEGLQVLSAIDVQIALQDPKNRAVAQCGGGVDCALMVGRLVAADLVVIGSITGLGNAFSLNLRALDVHRSREIGRHQASVSGRDKLIPEMRLAAYRLVAPDRIRGWLVVDIDVAGVEIEIDGKIVGVTPLSQPVENLTPGEHVVSIKRPGYRPFQQQFTIHPFEPTKLTIALASAKP